MTIEPDDDRPTEPTVTSDGPSYEAGYKRPPKETRFKKGQSGNPRGRPRGAKGRKAMLGVIAGKVHLVVENGVERARTTVALVSMALSRKAAGGNLPALRALHELQKQVSPEAPQGGCLLVPERPSVLEWHRAFCEPETFEKLEAEGVFQATGFIPDSGKVR